jgi:hypothetical protein
MTTRYAHIEPVMMRGAMALLPPLTAAPKLDAVHVTEAARA